MRVLVVEDSEPLRKPVIKALKASGDPDWLFKWVSDAPKIKPGIIMPVWLDKEGGTLDEATIRMIVTYLQGLGK